jgi:hypothetical protein
MKRIKHPGRSFIKEVKDLYNENKTLTKETEKDTYTNTKEKTSCVQGLQESI